VTYGCIELALHQHTAERNFARITSAWYTGRMQDELEFRRNAESALSALKQHLIALEEEDDAGFEVEEQGGVIQILFEEPTGKFVVTPNAPIRQIWISALSTSFKLDWSADQAAFILPRTGELLTPLVERLIAEHLDR
jgi:iron donor protein CyaY